MQFENHPNYNCEITTNQANTYRVYANWLHNNGLDHWSGWHCAAGSTRLLIDKNFEIYGGECLNDHLGSALTTFSLLSGTVCRQATCTGCTDDLMVAKHHPDHE